mgnify:CR=1 FL=1
MFKVGEKLKRIRKRKNISQYEFAEFLGISQNYLSEIESGKYVPSLKTFKFVYVLNGKEISKEDAIKYIAQKYSSKSTPA